MAGFPDHEWRHAARSQGSPAGCAVKRIGIALFNGFSLPDAAAVAEIFHSANTQADTNRGCVVRYDVCLLSASGGRISSSSSALLWTETIGTGHDSGNFHALFIAGGAGVNTALRDGRLVDWLRHIAPYTKAIFPIAEGRLLLDAAELESAAAGALHGGPHTQVLRDVLKSRLPPEAIHPLRAALAVVENDLGAGIAHKIASGIEPLLETPFAALVSKNASVGVSEKIRSSALWLEMNGERAIKIDDVAKIAAMSSRNFLRRFKIEMGVTPSDYLLFVRLDMCCRLLAESDLPVDKVARRCGISSGGRLSKLFRRYLGTTPTEYRLIKRRLTASV